MYTDSEVERAADGDVVAWREQRFEAVGFDPGTAGALACDRAFDLHELLALIERGCPPHLAVQILAPLEQRRRRC